MGFHSPQGVTKRLKIYLQDPMVIPMKMWELMFGTYLSYLESEEGMRKKINKIL